MTYLSRWCSVLTTRFIPTDRAFWDRTDVTWWVIGGVIAILIAVVIAIA